MRQSRVERWRVSAAGSIAVVVLAAACPSARAVGEQELFRALNLHGVRFDTNAVVSSAVTNMIKAIDPRGRLLTAEQVKALGTGKTVADSEVLPEEIYYLKLNGLCAGGGKEVADTLAEWCGKDASGLILDLRGASGTDLAAVDKVAGMLTMTNTALYSLRDSDGQIVETHEAKARTNACSRIPHIVLTDGETRDASEVLAATLKHRCRVMLVGSRTLGDPGVRAVIPLSETESLYVATRWVVPVAGGEFGAVGIEPDVKVEATVTGSVTNGPSDDRGMDRRPLSAKAIQDIELMHRVQSDSALSRAVDILLGLKALHQPVVPVLPKPTETPPVKSPDAVQAPLPPVSEAAKPDAETRNPDANEQDPKPEDK